MPSFSMLYSLSWRLCPPSPRVCSSPPLQRRRLPSTQPPSGSHLALARWRSSRSVARGEKGVYNSYPCRWLQRVEELITMPFTIEVEQEDDGRWLTEIPALPGVLAYGQTREEAIARAQVLALRVLADRLEHGESVPAMDDVFAVVA